MASFDRYITVLMNKYQIPGGAVAVAKDGKLVLAHGYGMADIEAHHTVTPDSLFRVASISKPFTAVAVLTFSCLATSTTDRSLSSSTGTDRIRVLRPQPSL